MTIEALVARYGAAAIFAGAALEGEAAAVAGGLLAHQGLVWLPLAAFAAAAGSFLADQGWFTFGRRFREHRRVAALRRRPAFARAVAALERRPIGFIFAFRFLWGLRTVSPIAIGTTQVSRGTFAVVNGVSAAAWAVIFTGIGFFFGEAFEALMGRLRNDARLWWIVGAFIVAGAVAGVIHWWRSRDE